MAKALKPTELQEQIRIFEWAEIQSRTYSELSLLYHINNNSRSVVRGALNKRAGVKKGFPDLCLPVARKGFHALYIELKAEGGTLKLEQVQQMDALRRQDNLTCVCYGAEQAIRIILAYLKGTIDE